MIDEVFWLLTASRIAGIGLVISLTVFTAVFLVWLAFSHLERQFKRLMRSLEIKDIHEFGEEYYQWKKEKKEDTD